MSDVAAPPALVFRRRSGLTPLALDPSLEIGAGGEARVFAVPGGGLVAKVYHEPTAERARTVARITGLPAGALAYVLGEEARDRMRADERIEIRRFERRGARGRQGGRLTLVAGRRLSGTFPGGNRTKLSHGRYVSGRVHVVVGQNWT